MQKYLLFFLFILGFHIAVAQVPSSVIDSLQPSCNGVCDGYARVKITGGTPPYSLFWNTTPVQSTTSASNLCPGTYRVTILDANNLSTISTVTIPIDVVHATVTHTNLSCRNYGVDTAIIAAASSLGPFSYVWNNRPATASDTATNFPVGANTVLTTDAYGCTTTDTFIILQPTEITFSNVAHSALCYDSSSGSITTTLTGGTAPYSYEWDNDTTLDTINLSHASAGMHVLTVKDSTNCVVTDTAYVSQPTPISFTFSPFNLTCYNSGNGVIDVVASGGTPPYSYSWNTTPPQAITLIKYLSAGTYTVTVTDSNNCIVSDSVTLTQPPLLSDSTQKTDLICYGRHNGRGEVFPFGGVPPYHITWINPAVTGNIDSTLTGGANPVSISDANGCYALDTIKISQPPAIVITITQTPDTGGCTGTATALVTGGTGAYTYLWNTGATTTAIANLCPIKYTLHITDSNNCTATDSVLIKLKARTGIANVTQTSITIAPNPFSQYIVVNYNGASSAQIRITNATGITVYSSAIENSTGKNTISTANWAPGFYFISIVNAEGNVVYRGKLVKQ